MFASRIRLDCRSLARHYSLICLSLIVLLVAWIPEGSAQTVYGSVVGLVTDSSGAAVPNATVTITKIETNETRQTTTNQAGSYSLTTVPAGTYHVTISQLGFKLFEAQNVVVDPM
jgi:hypothetical protein